MTAFSKVIERDKLKPKRDPYWTKLMAGCYMGFRKMSASSDGSYSARFSDKDTGKRHQITLGAYSERPDNERYELARKDALNWFEHLGRGGTAEVLTVQNICERYVVHKKNEKNESGANDAHLRFKRYVYKTKLSKLDVTKLKRSHFVDWRKLLEETVTESGPNKGELRKDSTLNRDMTCLRSALNLAFKEGLITSDFAWQGKLVPIKNAEHAREAYLDLAQRRKLYISCPPDLADFVKCSCLIPLRCGAIAKLIVGNYDSNFGTLSVFKDKTKRHRKISLPPEAADLFNLKIKDKLPGASIFTRLDGMTWNKDAWKDPIRAAVLKAELPSNVTMGTIRHSVITDLVHGGLDTLTVAQLAGTSIMMIEKHYGHLTQKHSKEALSKLVV